MDTIFALSSGAPPAAIGVIRISGTAAADALEALAGRLPPPRRPSLARLKDTNGALLDEALLLWFPGPATATGEDCAEIQCHGGRAVIAAISARLAQLPGLRAAGAGEFTQRAFANGRLDLAQAEGLADLLAAETELQRAVAVDAAGGTLSQMFTDWRSRLLILSAHIESALDFSDEDDVAGLPPSFEAGWAGLHSEIRDLLERPRVERLKDGIRVVLAGPPNAGKSMLFNAILQTDAAIVSPIAGTTRDAIERPVSIDGVPFVFIDTAGLRAETSDAIEQIGIGRAQAELERADIILWLGPEGEGPRGSWEIATRSDEGIGIKDSARFTVSGLTGDGIAGLASGLSEAAKAILPGPGESAINARQAQLLGEAARALATGPVDDLLVTAENLRSVRFAFDRILGTVATEDMLDTLFGRFCIGK